MKKQTETWNGIRLCRPKRNRTAVLYRQRLEDMPEYKAV